MVFIWWELWLLIFCWLFLFCFCLVRGKKVASAQDFGWQLKGEDHFRSWFPFLPFLFIWWQFCIVQILSGPKTSQHISSGFFDQELSSFFFSLLSLILWLGLFFLFFFLSPSLWLGISLFPFFLWLEIFLLFFFDWKFSSLLLPRVRIDILTPGQGLWWVRILAQGL